MRDRDLSAIIARVMRYTVNLSLERITWQKAPAIVGVLAWGDAEAIAVVQGWIDRAVEMQTSEGCLNYSDIEEYGAGHALTLTPTAGLIASLGYPLLSFYERTKDARYLDAAQRQIEALDNAPRTREGGIWARHEGPELWIDWIYMMCPFLARYGKITGRSEPVDEAFKQFEVHVKHLVDPHTNLARHAWCEVPNSYPQSTLWARGNGWLTAGAVQLLELSPDHPKSAAAAEVARKAMIAMAELQDRSGYLHHLLDDPRSKLESSSSVMFAYSVAKAVTQGILDAAYLDAAVRALEAVSGEVDAEGAVQGVAVPPGGPGVPFASTPYGQGFFLMAADVLRDPLGL